MSIITPLQLCSCIKDDRLAALAFAAARLARNARAAGGRGSELGYAVRVTARCWHGSGGSPDERCTATLDGSSRKVTSRTPGAHVPNPKAQKMNIYSRFTLLV